jgi:cadmium resistance protein CadD (predicted permease)
VMDHLLITAAAAAGMFVGTDVDAFVPLVALFLGSRNGGPGAWQTVLGQYLVFAAVKTHHDHRGVWRR